MRIRKVSLPAVLFLALVLLAMLPHIYAQELKPQDEKAAKTPIEKVTQRLSRGVKYFSGKNHIGQYEDDDVYTHYVYKQDKRGRTIRKIGYNVGPNNTKIISERYLKYYVNFKYDKKGRMVKDYSYNDKGRDNMWFTADDPVNYYSVYEYGAQGERLRVVRYLKNATIFDYTVFETNPEKWIVKDIVYKGKGPDGKWLTGDDEIEKYHTFDYDDKGNLLRAREYLLKLNGKGPDGAWFTADDAVSSTKVFTYNAKGELAQIIKYIACGPDNAWFTADDIPQYYTIYDFSGEKAIAE